MEMEMGMDSLSFYQHLHMNFPPSSASRQEALSYYYNPPLATASTNRRDDVDPTPPSQPPPPPRQKVAVVARRGRNSKICTAGGMRGRRMRLSLHVARRFFALQDKLGFDKASKTVQWLLDMSTAGINHLLTASMSLSEEDASGSVLLDNNDHIMVADAIYAETNNCRQQMPKARRRAPAPRKGNNGAPVLQVKESRVRARDRARERTKERNRLRSYVSVVEEAPAPARQVIPVPAAACSSSFEHGSGSYYDEQEPWELGGVVFANWPRY
jgi:hypothetical protein